MDWVQALAIIVANIAVLIPLFLWLRSEGNADRRELRGILDEIKTELKDFHGRMCTLEERYIHIITVQKPKTDP